MSLTTENYRLVLMKQKEKKLHSRDILPYLGGRGKWVVF